MTAARHCSCHAADLCKPFLNTVAELVESLRSTKHKTHGEPEHGACSCEMPSTCGPIAWKILHGTAAALRDDVCSNCGRHAVRIFRGLHDMINVKLGKPVHHPDDLLALRDMVNEAVANMKTVPVVAVADPGSLIESVRRLPWETAREKVFAVYLERPGGRVIAAREVAIGDRRTAEVPIGRMIEDGRKLGAGAVVMAHNHPSGNPTPSPEDLVVTTQVRRAAQRHGLTLAGHMIVAGDEVTTLK